MNFINEYNLNTNKWFKYDLKTLTNWLCGDKYKGINYYNYYFKYKWSVEILFNNRYITIIFINHIISDETTNNHNWKK